MNLAPARIEAGCIGYPMDRLDPIEVHSALRDGRIGSARQYSLLTHWAQSHFSGFAKAIVKIECLDIQEIELPKRNSNLPCEAAVAGHLVGNTDLLSDRHRGSRKQRLLPDGDTLGAGDSGDIHDGFPRRHTLPVLPPGTFGRRRISLVCPGEPGPETSMPCAAASITNCSMAEPSTHFFSYRARSLAERRRAAKLARCGSHEDRIEPVASNRPKNWMHPLSRLPQALGEIQDLALGSWLRLSPLSRQFLSVRESIQSALPTDAARRQIGGQVYWPRRYLSWPFCSRLTWLWLHVLIKG